MLEKTQSITILKLNSDRILTFRKKAKALRFAKNFRKN